MMRASKLAMIGAALLGTAVLPGTSGLGAAGATQAETAKTSSPVAMTSGKIALTATATYSDGSSADRLYRVTLDSDSDGDGLGDEAWLRIRCADGAVAEAFAHNVTSPRDAASGQASGRRMHKPFVIAKELDAASTAATSGKSVGWDIKTNKSVRTASGGKTMAHDSWAAVNLRDGAPNLCA